MPGFLGGSSGGSSGTGGEISFPKEFIDPVTKLRVSQPENLIDTDFEYGLQPTKWETVELINNTPSFFSKSGDTTIPNIISITTNAGTREITVVTALEHGVSVGIPISVTGTKSITADGSYIINSIPNTTTFTYLCKANQPTTASIEDLYSSIITGEFFQGSQLRISDASGIVTDSAEGSSTLTITTDSAHGFKTNTPFYFLNLNSTISKDFQASNTAAKSFDSTNSAVAQTFDGSNTLSSINIDWSNSATVGGVISNISAVSTINNTITVAHSPTENFANQPLGTPLYYAVTGGSGYFATNPRGVIFLKTITGLGTSNSTFQVSALPDGDVIPITAALSGTFQLANQARTFAGNNQNQLTQTNLTVIKESPVAFDGGNQGYVGAIETNGLCTVEGYAGTILVSTTAGAGLDYYVGTMVRYTTTGTAASGLVNNRTYFIASFTATVTPNQFRITIKELPTDAAALAPTGGTGDQTFQKIGISADKDIIHIKDASFSVKDMIEYSFPAGTGGRFSAASGEEKLFYFVQTAYDAHNYQLSESLFSATNATGGSISEVVTSGFTYKIHAFTTVGTSTFTVNSVGTIPTADVLIVGGGGGGGAHVPSGGGAGGLIYRPGITLTAQSYSIVVGAGGTGTAFAPLVVGSNGGNSSAFGLTALGGGFGQTWNDDNRVNNGGSGGGREGRFGARGLGLQPSQSGDSGTFGFGNAGANGVSFGNDPYPGGGGGGAGQAGQDQSSIQTAGDGGNGRNYSAFFGSSLGQNGWFASGGGGGSWGFTFGGRGRGGMGGGGVGDSPTGNGSGTSARGAGSMPLGEAGLANTGGGGGGAGRTGGETSRGGNGGSGVVLIRYSTTPVPDTLIAPSATGGQTVSDITVGTGASAIRYRVHRFTNTGTTNFVMSNLGNIAPGAVEVLLVGGGGGSSDYAGGGGGGEVVYIPRMTIGTGTFPVVVGAGGVGTRQNTWTVNMDGQASTVFGQTAKGGGGGKGSDDTNPPNNGTRTEVANGGGGSSRSSGYFGTVGTFTGGVTGFRFGGNRGGNTSNDNNGPNYPTGGGGGAGSSCPVVNTGGPNNAAPGGPGILNDILGTPFYFGGGGGGSTFYQNSGASLGGNGGIGGGGAGAGRGGGATGGGSALNAGGNTSNTNGGNGGANTGGGGGGAVNETGGTGGSGGSGIVVIRYQIPLT